MRAVKRCARLPILAGLRGGAPVVIFLLLLCTAVGAHEQRQQETDDVVLQGDGSSAEALLEAVSRFEAVGRVREARVLAMRAKKLHPSHSAPGLSLQRLDSGEYSVRGALLCPVLIASLLLHSV